MQLFFVFVVAVFSNNASLVCYLPAVLGLNYYIFSLYEKKSVKILLFSDHMEIYFCYHYKLGQYSAIQLELENHMIIANWEHWWMSCSDSVTGFDAFIAMCHFLTTEINDLSFCNAPKHRPCGSMSCLYQKKLFSSLLNCKSKSLILSIVEWVTGQTGNNNFSCVHSTCLGLLLTPF